METKSLGTVRTGARQTDEMPRSAHSSARCASVERYSNRPITMRVLTECSALVALAVVTVCMLGTLAGLAFQRPQAGGDARMWGEI